MASSVGGNGGIIGASNVPTAANPNAQVTDITSSGCFNRTGTTATVIVVGGGGGGAQAGGGAGGVLVTECHPLPASAVPVTIGAGGAGRPDPAPYADPGTSGSASVFGSATPLTANGGGGGGGNRGNGGGGGNETAAPAPPGTQQSVFGTVGQGFNGGAGSGFQQAGGGGGASQAGGTASTFGAHGGTGKNLQPYGVPKCIGSCGVLGGGGGGALAQFGDGDNACANCSEGPKGQVHNGPYSAVEQYAAGGIGGGGQGGVKIATPSGGIFLAPANGTANTGGGGGGDNAGYDNGPGVAGTGGSGRVIVVEPGVAAGTVGDGVYSMQAQFNAKAASRWK